MKKITPEEIAALSAGMKGRVVLSFGAVHRTAKFFSSLVEILAYVVVIASAIVLFAGGGKPASIGVALLIFISGILLIGIAAVLCTIMKAVISIAETNETILKRMEDEKPPDSKNDAPRSDFQYRPSLGKCGEERKCRGD